MEKRQFSMTLVGLTPLVMNNPETIMTWDTSDVRDKAAYEREHFREKLYCDSLKNLGIPARAIKRTLMAACRFIPDKPKKTAFKSYAPLIQGALLVEDDAILDVPPDKAIPWTVVVCLDPSKGMRGPRGPRCRPLIPLPWQGHTLLDALDEALDLVILSKIASVAGYQVGFLDARTIDMGRAEITLKEVKSR